jgi:hypothetical protein
MCSPLLCASRISSWKNPNSTGCFYILHLFAYLNYLIATERYIMNLGYQAVVCGMDPICCESSSWMETAQVEKLARGSSQPFYQV